MEGAVHVGFIQGPVTHVMYWLRTLPAPEHHRRVAHHDQHADGGHMLRPVCGPCHNAHPIIRHVQKTL